MQIEYNQLQESSRDFINAYYRASAYYSKREYRINKLTSSHWINVLQNIFENIIPYQNFDLGNIKIDIESKIAEILIHQYNIGSQKQRIHIYCLVTGVQSDLTDYNKSTLYSFVKQNWTISGYKNQLFFRDLNLLEREDVYKFLASTTKKLNFEFAEYFDCAQQWCAKRKTKEPRWFKSIFYNKKFFENGGAYAKEKPKTSKSRKIRNAVESFAYRSAETANEIVAGSGTQLLTSIVSNTPKNDVHEISSVLSGPNRAKFSSAVSQAAHKRLHE
jgi:hypothetical protein